MYVGEFDTGVNEGVRDGLNEAFSGVVEERDKVVGVSFGEVESEIGVNEGDDEERNKVDGMSFEEVTCKIGVR